MGTGPRHEPTSIERTSLTEMKLVWQGHKGKGGGGGGEGRKQHQTSRQGGGEKGEEGGGRQPSSTRKSWRSSTLTKGILLSESLLPPDRQKSERARCNYRARRESRWTVTARLRDSKGISRKLRSALVDMPLSKTHDVEVRARTRTKFLHRLTAISLALKSSSSVSINMLSPIDTEIQTCQLFNIGSSKIENYIVTIIKLHIPYLKKKGGRKERIKI